MPQKKLLSKIMNANNSNREIEKNTERIPCGIGYAIDDDAKADTERLRRAIDRSNENCHPGQKVLTRMILGIVIATVNSH